MGNLIGRNSLTEIKERIPTFVLVALASIPFVGAAIYSYLNNGAEKKNITHKSHEVSEEVLTNATDEKELREEDAKQNDITSEINVEDHYVEHENAKKLEKIREEEELRQKEQLEQEERERQRLLEEQMEQEEEQLRLLEEQDAENRRLKEIEAQKRLLEEQMEQEAQRIAEEKRQQEIEQQRKKQQEEEEKILREEHERIRIQQEEAIKRHLEQQKLQSIITVQSLWRRRKARIAFVTLVKNTQRRKNVIEELIETEQTYVESLQTISDVFIRPLFQSGIIPGDMVLTIFGNLDNLILQENLSLLRDLRERVGKQMHPHVQIGDIFVKHIKDLQCYAPYIINYNRSIEAYNKCLENPDFSGFIEQAESDKRCNQLDLNDFMIMPVQRLPRYELLLSDVFKCTDKASPDYISIQEALKQMKQLTNMINDQKRETDSINRIFALQAKLGRRSRVNLLKPGRLLIKEGMLQQIKKDGKDESPMFVCLFTDMVMCSKPTKVRKGLMDNTVKYAKEIHFPFDKLIIDDLLPADLKSSKVDLGSCFKLTADNQTIVLKANSPFEKKGWIQDLKAAVSKANENVTQ